MKNKWEETQAETSLHHYDIMNICKHLIYYQQTCDTANIGFWLKNNIG